MLASCLTNESTIKRTLEHQLILQKRIRASLYNLKDGILSTRNPISFMSRALYSSSMESQLKRPVDKYIRACISRTQQSRTLKSVGQARSQGGGAPGALSHRKISPLKIQNDHCRNVFYCLAPPKKYFSPEVTPLSTLSDYGSGVGL